MNTTEINIEKLARLSMLELNDGEKIRIEKELTLLVGYANTVMTGMSSLQEIQESKVNTLREDICEEEKHDCIIKLSPSYENGYITVPKVLEIQ